MNEFEIEFFTNADGKCPVSEFLDKLDVKINSKILSLMLLLERNGNELREPYTKHLGDGIFELRVKHSKMLVRVLFFFVVGQKIIFTNGFIKKTKKTPNEEINTAKRYRYEYLSKENNEYEI